MRIRTLFLLVCFAALALSGCIDTTVPVPTIWPVAPPTIQFVDTLTFCVLCVWGLA